MSYTRIASQPNRTAIEAQSPWCDGNLDQCLSPRFPHMRQGGGKHAG